MEGVHHRELRRDLRWKVWHAAIRDGVYFMFSQLAWIVGIPFAVVTAVNFAAPFTESGAVLCAVFLWAAGVAAACAWTYRWRVLRRMDRMGRVERVQYQLLGRRWYLPSGQHSVIIGWDVPCADLDDDRAFAHALWAAYNDRRDGLEAAADAAHMLCGDAALEQLWRNSLRTEHPSQDLDEIVARLTTIEPRLRSEILELAATLAVDAPLTAAAAEHLDVADVVCAPAAC